MHNLYQAKSAKLKIGEQSKVGLFFFFHFSLFVFHLSFFVIRFSLFVIRFRYSFFTFGRSPFVSAFRFSLFVFHFFDIQNRAQYRILTFKLRLNILFLHSKSYFDIQTDLIFWYSKSYFEIQNRAENRIFTFKILFWHSKSYFDILTGAEYRILTFKILFWHLNWGQISNFDIQDPILTFELRPNIKIGRNIAFWHSKSYFDIWLTGAEYRILTFKILFWHTNWVGISCFDIQNPILTIKLRLNIVFRHSKFYFDIRAETEYRNWHSKCYFGIQNLANTYFDIQNPISTFQLGPNIEFWL